MHLVEDKEAQDALHDALLRWKGTVAAWEIVTWVVLRDPGVGIPLTEDGAIGSFTYQGAKSIEQPTITVVYETTRMETTIRSALFTEPKFGQVGRS